jgi:hypothetical protein
LLSEVADTRRYSFSGDWHPPGKPGERRTVIDDLLPGVREKNMWKGMIGFDRFQWIRFLNKPGCRGTELRQERQVLPHGRHRSAVGSADQRRLVPRQDPRLGKLVQPYDLHLLQRRRRITSFGRTLR